MAAFIPAVLWLLGVGGSSATEVAGGAVVTTAARGAISYLAKEAAKKTAQQAAKKIVQETAQKAAQQTAKTIVTKTTQNGAVNSVFSEAAQIQQNAGWITQKVLHGAQSAEGSYRTFNQISQSMSKIRTFSNILPRP